MYRHAVVKGYFYPDNAPELTNFFESSKSTTLIKDPISVIVPHAGYIYSGRTAFKTLSSIDIPESVLILGPNHTGLGRQVALYCKGVWESPFGDVPVDSELADALCDNYIISKDFAAHVNEHSLEVIVPMLKYLNPYVKIVPLVIGLSTYEECLKVAERIAEILTKTKEKVLIVVSSDMNHYEDSETTLKKDNIAIDTIIHLDGKKLYEVIEKYNITMCGFAPAIIAIESSKILGASEGILIGHTHSGVVSGNNREVVGYAGIIIK